MSQRVLFPPSPGHIEPISPLWSLRADILDGHVREVRIECDRCRTDTGPGCETCRDARERWESWAQSVRTPGTWIDFSALRFERAYSDLQKAILLRDDLAGEGWPTSQVDGWIAKQTRVKAAIQAMSEVDGLPRRVTWKGLGARQGGCAIQAWTTERQVVGYCWCPDHKVDVLNVPNSWMPWLREEFPMMESESNQDYGRRLTAGEEVYYGLTSLSECDYRPCGMLPEDYYAL